MTLVYKIIFQLGYLFFNITGKTWWYAYVSFRRLFVLTKGGSNDKMSAQLSRSFPPIKLNDVSGVLGTLTHEKIQEVVANIDKNGYHIFDATLSASKVEALVELSLNLEAELIPAAKDGTKRAKYDRKNPLSPRYQFNEQEILRNKLIQEISFDRSLYAIAQGYLKCIPIQDLTAVWWSTAFSKQASSEAAQLYHFDMDRFKFIKFFFYLTDVDSTNGPHCYIRGSHKQMPDKVWKDGRIPDNEVQESFPKEDILEITGKKGSIIAVDTRGLHKGKVLEKGERLILQIEYTNSLFGAEYQHIDLKGHLDKDLQRTLQDQKHPYQRFTI